MIKIQSVSYKYAAQSNLALSAVSLEISMHDHWVFLGRNGSGKSTLVKLIAGLLTLQEGSIEVAGKPVLGPTKQLIPGNKNIAFVDQEMVIEPYLTVIQNLKSGLIGASYTEPEAQKLIEELLHIAQLEGFENQKVATLSLGQKQRLSLAKAFTFDKPILVFDEPFNNVDAVTRARFIAKLQQLNNKTILSVVHSTTDAFQLGNQVAILHEGKILEHGAIHELYEQPSTLISATYLGQLCAIQLQDSKLHFRPQYLSEKPSQSDDIKLVVKSYAIKNLGDFTEIKLQTNYGELLWFDAVKNANNFKSINQLYIPQNKLLRLC